MSVRRTILSATIVLAVMLIGARDASAQRDTTLLPKTHQRLLCWRGRPEAQCRSFLITEIGVDHPVVTTRSSVGGTCGTVGDDFCTRRLLALGLMINVDRRQAIGASVSRIDDGDLTDPPLIELRYRRWNGSTGVDFSAGPRQVTLGSPGSASGLTASVGAEAGYVAGNVRVDVLRAEGRSYRAVFVGGRVTSHAAAAVAATVFAVFLIGLGRQKPGF
jgi:hypothetical protein